MTSRSCASSGSTIKEPIEEVNAVVLLGLERPLAVHQEVRGAAVVICIGALIKSLSEKIKKSCEQKQSFE